MTQNQLYRVVREHVGDRPYAEGEVRISRPEDVAHLVPHVLEPLGEKSETKPSNKAESAAPANKADPGRKAKTKA